MPFWIEALVSVFLIIGSLFARSEPSGCTACRIYTRLHGPTKATTLGVGGIVIASMFFSSRNGGLSLHELLITLFLFLTAPVSAHMLAKAAMQRNCPQWSRPAANPGIDARS